MSHHHNDHCSTVAQTISRQVGPHSPLYCHPSNNNNNVNSHECDCVCQAISRQVGPRSPLFRD